LIFTFFFVLCDLRDSAYGRIKWSFPALSPTSMEPVEY